MVRQILLALFIVFSTFGGQGCGNKSDPEMDRIVDTYQRGGTMSQRERELLEERLQEEYPQNQEQ